MAILGCLLLILCQLYRISGKEIGFMERLPPAGVQEESERITVQGQAALPEQEPELTLYAKGAVLMDGYTGRVLYEKNAAEAMPMASTTKIMTCILALEYGNPEDWVEVSAYAASMPDVQLGINKGERYRLGDLLLSLMLESHNDSAVAIAEHIASIRLEAEAAEPVKESGAAGNTEKTAATGSTEKTAAAGSTEKTAAAGSGEKTAAQRTTEESKELVTVFAGLMNQKAREIGCENTFFITPNGLDASVVQEDAMGNPVEQVHSTTAEELAQIMRYCVSQSEKSRDFLELTQTRDASITEETGNRSFSCANHNRYLDMMEGAISGKTGFTGNAGYCYVGAVNQNGVYLIVSLLACGWPPSKNLKWQDMNTLVKYGLENYSCVQIREIQETCGDYILRSYDGNGKMAGIKKMRTEIQFEPFLLLMKDGETTSWSRYLDLKEAMPGERVGTYRLMVGQKICRTFPVLVQQTEKE